MNTMIKYSLRNWFLFESCHISMRRGKQRANLPLQPRYGEAVTAMDAILFYLLLLALGTLVGEMVLQSFFRIAGVS